MRLVGRGGRRRQLGVELVRLAPARRDDLVEVRAERVGRLRTRRAAAAAAARRSPPARPRRRYQNAALVPAPVGVDRGGARDDVVVDAVLRVRRAPGAPKSRSALVSFSQKSSVGRGAVGRRRRRRARAGPRNGWSVVDRAAVGAELRLRARRRPRPRCCGTRRSGSTCSVSASGPAFVTRTVISRSCRVGLGVVGLDDPVAVVVEDAGVEQLELRIVLAAAAVLVDEIARTGTRPADSGSASGSRRGSASRRGTTSTPWRPRRGCPGCR